MTPDPFIWSPVIGAIYPTGKWMTHTRWIWPSGYGDLYIYVKICQNYMGFINRMETSGKLQQNSSKWPGVQIIPNPHISWWLGHSVFSPGICLGFSIMSAWKCCNLLLLLLSIWRDHSAMVCKMIALWQLNIAMESFHLYMFHAFYIL